MFDPFVIPKQTSPDYPGVCAEWPGFRVIVGGSLEGGQSVYYRLQALLPVANAAQPQWLPVAGSSSPTLAKFLAKLARSTVGLVDAVQGLPDDPASASPAFNAARLRFEAACNAGPL